MGSRIFHCTGLVFCCRSRLSSNVRTRKKPSLSANVFKTEREMRPGTNLLRDKMNLPTIADAKNNPASACYRQWSYPRRMLKSLLPLLGLCLSAYVSAAEHSQRAFLPNETLCKAPSPIQETWLDAAWANYLQYVRVCRIAAADGRDSVMLISVWADLYYSDRTISEPIAQLPKPLLVNPTGARLGELPVNFPSDPPVELNIYFSDWRNGLPNRIDLCVVSPTASGNQRLLPLKFTQKVQRYQPAPERGLKKRLKDCNDN